MNKVTLTGKDKSWYVDHFVSACNKWGLTNVQTQRKKSYFSGSKYLLPGVKADSKTHIPGCIN